MLKIKLVAAIPWPLGFLSCALFNVRKGTKTFFSVQIGSDLGVGREQPPFNVNEIYILTFVWFSGIRFI